MDAGYLVDYGDKSRMVQLIQSILDDHTQAKAKVKLAKEYITTNLKIEKIAEEYEKLYQQCIGSDLQARRES